MAAIGTGAGALAGCGTRSPRCPAQRIALPTQSPFSVQLSQCSIDSGFERRCTWRDAHAVANRNPAARVAGWPDGFGDPVFAGTGFREEVSRDRTDPVGRSF